MIRQYVGARYVPKFASPVEWAADTSYEALTIVTFNNASYTSKVPVPPTVGNPANNPQYWALTGNYNAQVEQYRQETETVSNNLTTEITKVEQYRQETETVSNNLTTEITNRKNADTTLQGQITTEITNRENADTTLQGQITTEITNRENADTTEITNRENADATLQNNINAEATARQSADNTLQGNINSEAATRASADSNLQSQINQIIAPSGEAPSAAEVQNARIGADGVTYDTLGTAIRTQVNDINEALNETVVRVNNNNFQYGYWTESGTHDLKYIRLCNKTAIHVYKGDRLEFSPDGLYVSFLVFSNEPSGTSQSYLEITPYQTSANVINYTIQHDGYLVFNMQNAEDWNSSTQPSSTKQYNAILVVYRYAVIEPVEDRIDSLNEALIKQLDPQELYKQKTATSINGYYEAGSEGIKGFGTLVTKLPLIITNIEINTVIKGTGSAKLELLDENKVVVATATSTFTNKLVFEFNDLYVGNYDKLWIRVSSETLLIARAECNINANIVDTSENYATYFANDNWYYTNHNNYTLLFTLNGKISNNSVIVGDNEKFKRINDAVQYCNIRPNYVWNLYIKEGVYDIYNELGGSNWYSSITGTKGNMQGLSLANNVNLIGIGKVILQFNPSDNIATENNVPNVSVIELGDINNKIENIKIECKNCRYGVHDETDGGKPNSTRYFKNVEITHNGVVSGTWTAPVSYGCGSSDNSKFEYVDCKFNSGWLAHQNNKQTIPPNFIATNCVFSHGSYAISLNTSGTCKANITFNNCEINYMVRILEDSDVWSIYGSGNNLFSCVVIGNNKINSQPFKLYDLTRTFKNIGDSKITKGNAVQIDKGGVSKGNNAKQIVGIALNDAEQNTDVRVQLKGYYDCYGVSPFEGNNTLLGVSNGAIVANDENYFAIGVYVDDLQMIYIY